MLRGDEARVTSSCVSPVPFRTLPEYVAAMEWQHGKAGAFLAEEFDRINSECFGGELPFLPLTIGLTIYGKRIGLTRCGWNGEAEAPRITIASWWFRAGANHVRDTLLHEMIHARLRLDGEDTAHNSEPWCREITRLSPLVLGYEIKAQPVKHRRVPKAKLVEGEPKYTRAPLPGFVSRKTIAGWPHTLRPRGFDPGEVLHAPID
jgi:hypothetical protein